ncbi:MAG: DUF6088 family protein [Aliidongia sp.]
MLVDGLTAANDLGLSDAVPAKIAVHTDARLRPIKLGAQTITFKPTAPSRLYWAGRPGMRVVQALHWLRDMLSSDHERIARRLVSILADPEHGPGITADLREGPYEPPRLDAELSAAIAGSIRSRRPPGKAH